MAKQLLLFALALLFTISVSAQDSVWVRLRPKYNEASGLHKIFFGENYRKEWSDSTRLPVIDLSTIEGGLKPVRLGGGHQTVSLRMISAKGNEWVLRNIEKDASILLPPEIRHTFARELIDDAMSAQHPFSPLVVAEIAEAVHVPHAHPVIGVVNGRSLPAEFNKYFDGKVCLLEEREPMGKSQNSARLFADLTSDNDNRFDAEEFMRARLLDLLIGDWDRHPDQWRWVDIQKGKTKNYIGIPRDRDQAFYLNQGLFPRLVSRPWFVPSLQGFRGEIWFPRYSLKESSFMHSWPAMHMSYEKWMSVTHAFVAALTNDVLENALKKLPAAAYKNRHKELFDALKQRRDNIPQAMEEYYRFIQRIAELRLSDKAEWVDISQQHGDSISVAIYKVGKKGKRDPLHLLFYDPRITKEIRLYTGKGNDTVRVNVQGKAPVLRIIGGEGKKHYTIASAESKLRIYENDSISIDGDAKKRARLYVSGDSLHTAFSEPNRYNVIKPLVTGGFNRDDGFLIGLGLQYTHQGFRKLPYAGLNRVMVNYSFATSAFRIRYAGEFIKAIGNADFVTQADVFAPENTQNFFGRGNESIFNKTGTTITFYRTRFSLYYLSAGLRWRMKNGMSFIVAPSLQHYRFDSSDNRGRILNVPGSVFSYDSSTISRNKTHAGVLLNFSVNKRNNRIIPSSGYVINLKLQALDGLNNYSKAYAQFIPELVKYFPLNKTKNFVLAERLGGGVSIGKPAFYQSLFAGGHENLLGYRQYRFAGEQMLYNNLELRKKIAGFTGYIVPGEFGAVGFYDVGRVWIKGENSRSWHQGAGGGLYFAPAKLAVISIVAGYSNEGWYPYITFGFRY